MLTTDNVAHQFYRGSTANAGPGTGVTRVTTLVHTVTDTDPDPISLLLDGRLAPEGLLQVTHNGLVMTPEQDYRVLDQDGRSRVEVTVPRERFVAGDTLVVSAQLS